MIRTFSIVAAILVWWFAVLPLSNHYIGGMLEKEMKHQSSPEGQGEAQEIINERIESRHGDEALVAYQNGEQMFLGDEMDVEGGRLFGAIGIAMFLWIATQALWAAIAVSLIRELPSSRRLSLIDIE